MNGDVDITRVEQLNQLTRAGCVLALLITFCLAFLVGVFRGQPVVSIEAFVGVLMTAMVWLFKSRDEDKRRADMMPTTPTVTPQPGEGPTITRTGPGPSKGAEG